MIKPYYTEFRTQRNNARRRNIDWQFTYDEWIEWWGEDITNRGRKNGQLVMARNGDVGPYNVQNVQKLKAEENASDAVKGKHKTVQHISSMKKPKTIQHAINISNASTCKKSIMTPIGKFDSINAAASALNIIRGTVRDRIIRGTEGYHYV